MHVILFFQTPKRGLSYVRWGPQLFKTVSTQYQAARSKSLLVYISDGSNNRNRMLFWQPQPRCGCEYDNRNCGYFFNNREYF